ncbi:MAG: GrpB family protein [Peptococcaceae bacterium]|nr:GrpB family protein [Peptococcaceae bacterium]
MDNRDTVTFKADAVTSKQELHNGKIVLEEYNPLWPVLFEQEADRIRIALGNRAVHIYHVGSTSVPGLSAKPIIDVLLVVVDSSDEVSYVPDLELIGYTLHIREPDWFQHRLLRGRCSVSVNLHVFSENTPEIEQMLRFRNWLRSHDDDRDRYEKVKRELSQHTWRYVQDYADAKTAIIQEIINNIPINKVI